MNLLVNSYALFSNQRPNIILCSVLSLWLVSPVGLGGSRASLWTECLYMFIMMYFIPHVTEIKNTTTTTTTTTTVLTHAKKIGIEWEHIDNRFLIFLFWNWYNFLVVTVSHTGRAKSTAKCKQWPNYPHYRSSPVNNSCCRPDCSAAPRSHCGDWLSWSIDAEKEEILPAGTVTEPEAGLHWAHQSSEIQRACWDETGCL